MATCTEIEVKSATRAWGIVDPWLLGRWGLNLYRGCQHGCSYCDGRAEKYRVQGNFETDITVKRNIVALFDQEMRRRRESGFLLVGGGVSDSWQPVERTRLLARGTLQVALKHGLSVHVLTKSALVERDLELLAAIHDRSRAIVSFSINTLDEAVRRHFEPGASPIEERWRVLSLARSMGLGTGVMALPLLPGISDQPQAIDALVCKAATLGVDFISLGGLTLRPGVQKQTFLARLAQYDPVLVPGYQKLFASERPSGAPDPRYQARLEGRFRASLRNHAVPGRAPQRLFHGCMPLYAEVAVLLEHRQFELGLHGGASQQLARSGIALQHWARSRLARHARTKGFDSDLLDQEFLSRVHDNSLLQVPGVSPEAWPVIQQLVGTLTTGDPPRSGC